MKTVKPKLKIPRESINKEIELRHCTSVFSLVSSLLNSVPSKDILTMMHIILLQETAPVLYTTMAFLANKSDKEKVETLAVLQYVLENWDKILKTIKKEKSK
jgi:hypothetical protein